MAGGRPRSEHSYFVTKDGPAWVGYYYLYDDQGKRHQKRRRIAGRDQMKKTEAADEHSKWVREHVVASGTPALPKRVQLITLWERHISSERARVSRDKLDKQTVSQQVSLWKHLEPLAHIVAAEIPASDIEKLFDEVRNKKTGQPLKAESKGHLRKLLRTLLRPVTLDAINDAKLRFDSDGKGDTLTKEHVKAVRLQLPTDHDRLVYDVYMLLGLRASEGTRISPKHLATRGVLLVPGRKTKLSRSKMPLSEFLTDRLAALAQGRGDDDPLFYRQKGHRTWLEDVLQPAAVRAGAGHADMLMLRRTALTAAAAKDKGAASKLARHTSTRTIEEVYDSAPWDRLVDLQDDIAAVLVAE